MIRESVTVLTVLAVVCAPVAVAGSFAGVAAADTSLSMDLLTTHGDELTGSPERISYDQDVHARISYEGLGSGSNTLRVVDEDPWPDTDEVVATTTVDGRSGTATVVLPYSELGGAIDDLQEIDGVLELRVQWVSGENVLANSGETRLGRTETTVYLEGRDGGEVPDTAPVDEETALEVYGWAKGDRDEVQVDLRHRTPSGSDRIGDLRTADVDDNQFDRVVDFVPERDTDAEVGDTLRVFARPFPEEDGPSSTVHDVEVVAGGADPVARFTYSPSSPTVGDPVTFDASASTDPDGSVAGYEWRIDGDRVSTDRTFDHTFDTAGDHEVTLTVTDDEGETNSTTRTVPVAGTAGRAGTVVVENATTPPGGSATLAVRLDAVPDGLQVYNLTVSLANETVATVESAEGGAITGDAFEVVSQSAGTVTVRAADLGDAVRPGDGPVVLATLRVTGDVAGETPVEATVHRVTDDDGSEMRPAVWPGRVTVSTSPFDAPVGGGEGPPTDPDGDGEYEDVDGDGAAAFDDAVTLAFVNGGDLDDAQTAALDFDGDGDVDFDDAIELAFQV